MKRALLVMLFIAGCPDGACYILSGDVACNVDADCPQDVPFCVDRGAEEGSLEKTLGGNRICSDVAGADCSDNADCTGNVEGDVFCTRTESGTQACRSSCDAANECINDVGEFCIDGECLQVGECDSDDDCFDGEECFATSNLNVGCAPAGDACTSVDDVVCLEDNLLCETREFQRCMPGIDAVGTFCGVETSFDELAPHQNVLFFINEAERIACEEAGGSRAFCVTVLGSLISDTTFNAFGYASNADIVTFVLDEAGAPNGEVFLIDATRVATDDPVRSEIAFVVETDVAPTGVGVQLQNPDPGNSNPACSDGIIGF